MPRIKTKVEYTYDTTRTPESARSKYKLSDEQYYILTRIASQHKVQKRLVQRSRETPSIEDGEIMRATCIYGPAGTGKSRLIESIKYLFGRDARITATTGAASVLIHGSTIHRVLALRTMEDDVLKRVQGDAKTKERIKRTRILVIDEVSMLSAEAIDLITSLLKAHGPRPDLPCGGIILVLVGDLLQLPPVITSITIERYKKRYGEVEKMPRFIFQSNFFLDDESTPNICSLTKNFRQNDPAFQAMLVRLRLGEMTAEDQALLDTRLLTTARVPTDKNGTKPTFLYVRCKDVDNHNQTELAQIQAPSIFFRRKVMLSPGVTIDNSIVKHTLDNTNLAENVELKIGAQIILLTNFKPENGLVNGSRGVILDIKIAGEEKDEEKDDEKDDDNENENDEKDEKDEQDRVVVKFENGVTETIQYTTRDIYDLDGHVIGSYSQMPLCLGYAVTIHKSQGMTLQSAVVTLDNIFEDGMAYVAISRVASLQGLYIRLPNYTKFNANAEVLEYLSDLQDG